MEEIDFENVLAVAAPDAEQIGIPSWVSYEDERYFYVVRRANRCGQIEQSLCAAVVVLTEEGALAAARPNSVFEVKVERFGGGRVRLVWFYSPLRQQAEPSRFEVCFDGGTGGIDWENPLVEIRYKGRRFYSYESEMLDEGRYLFSVRAEDSAGTSDGAGRSMGVDCFNVAPGGIEILGAGAI